ncbi:hypothetical protein TCAL_07940 [Tigriopus californicus]|uniref:CYTH domain-containing protein n=1 Tax=Tigriopus californicus TaxID=6832 RepID=A0A553NFZ1_TIGCA|nr:adenylate cyclase CyaB-like [Tigriopus californicus]TRY64374.1 hypothetical protein TCAL_07940 [Tigriopus californicus]
MPRNVEIKARVSNLDAVRLRAAQLSNFPEKLIRQRDTFFQCDSGRLKLRFLEGEESQLIFYQRDDQEGPKLSNYHWADIGKPEVLENVLGLAYGVKGTVIKTRYLYLVGQTRVHCDQVEGLGDFAELEVVLRDDQTPEEGEVIAHELMAELGIFKEDVQSCAYMDLILKKNNSS